MDVLIVGGSPFISPYLLRKVYLLRPQAVYFICFTPRLNLVFIYSLEPLYIYNLLFDVLNFPTMVVNMGLYANSYNLYL